MTSTLRTMLVLLGAALFVSAVFLGYRLIQVVTVQRVGSVIIRHPGLPPTGTMTAPKRAASVVRQNLAPLATVSASSINPNNQSGEGVADGVPDSRDWISNGETAGAWIKLEWREPVTVSEIDLFDLPRPTENILSGALGLRRWQHSTGTATAAGWQSLADSVSPQDGAFRDLSHRACPGPQCRIDGNHGLRARSNNALGGDPVPLLRSA